MGILKSLFTLGKSFISQAEESIEETQGVRMLEQHIRDAKAELDKAGKSRVDLLARVKLSHDKLKDLRERKASLEARALEALSKNVNPSLINEVAEEIARLENLITAEEQVLSNLEVSRDGVEKAVTATAQRIAQFEQQMEVVKATEAMQRAQQAVTTSTVGASSSVSTAAESLKRLQTRQAERQARLDAAAQLEKVADGRDLDEKLAEAGIGGSNKSSAQDVLARLQRQQGRVIFASLTARLATILRIKYVWFFQRLFGKDNKPAIARGPLGLHLNSGFTLDTLAFRLLEDALLIALPGEEYTVAAVSCIDLGGGSQIFRYYTSGDEFLQINTTGGEDIDDIDDIKLFVYEESYGISKESHWREAINAKVMGAMTLNWQGKTLAAIFNSEEPGNIEPVYMLEKVENQNHAKWEVHNFSMGYQRQVTGDTYEYLLLNGEESFNDLGEPEWLFSRALGVDIPLTSLHIIG